MHPRIALAAASLLPIVLASCVGAGEQPYSVAGDCAPVFEASVCTWATASGDDIVEFGATIPLAAIENAPEHAEMAWPPQADARVLLPAIVRERTGMTMLTVFWEPHGHPPGPYMYPHFDFHFYNIDRARIDAIDCSDERKPDILPHGYVLPDEEIPELGTLVGICVPQMGMHALLGDEFYGTDAFEGTMVVGYYETEPIFIEPMITAELLLRRESFELPIPALTPPAGVRYPTRFVAEYDAATDSYRFVFSGI
jgi:hypothetical protein